MAEEEFDKEQNFEHSLIHNLFEKGWENKVLKYPTEDDLMKNWADILYQNNRQIDRLGNYPLTKGEMQQLVNKINDLRTPFNLNGFINGKTTSIKRDNPDDKLHLGKEVTLKLYDRAEIAGGQSRYQIAGQPEFNTPHPLMRDRRGDFMLLINGMPVVHVELKKSDDILYKAENQIEIYTHEGVFRRGILSLVQVFVAMTPGRMHYFANPGYDGEFNKKFYFHWADFNNNECTGWHNIAEQFLSIPFVHQLIGFYTVADKTDGTLKVMRSYQYYAALQVSNKVAAIEQNKWIDIDSHGGYIAHATGSGKTMTSFKSALLIADSKDADKVIFLVDRIELDTQSADQYKNFSADKDPEVQDTADTNDLITKLKNNDDVLIVTSIQKMSRIKENNTNQHDLDIINRKRIVVILDECHRSTFGDMLKCIKATLKHAVYFGFTGTPITEANKKKLLTTADLFGNELHRYSLADAITDKNVLGFDPYLVPTYKNVELRKKVALSQVHASSEKEAMKDERKRKKYLHFMNDIAMAGSSTDTGDYQKGIEDYIPESDYNCDKHRKAVVKDIKDNWVRLSMNSKYHALLATSSISEAVEYYKLFKMKMPRLKVTCLFDPTDDFSDGSGWKEDAIVEILEDYAKMFDMKSFGIKHYGKFKKDVSARLAHKEPYRDIDSKEQLNLLIVVNQMLTGYDSKWLNTLYVDKMLQYEQLIQACSRTNRLADWDKQNGIIRYYRRVYTMKRNQDNAIKLYAGDKALAVFVNKLPENIRLINSHFATIRHIFNVAKIMDFSHLPEEKSERQMFAKEFHILSQHVQAAKLQGFNWENPKKVDGVDYQVDLDERTYNILLTRYKELFNRAGGSGGNDDDPPYDLNTHITELPIEKVNADYMNSRFDKYVRTLQGNNPTEAVQAALDELHKAFASLTKDKQKIAKIILGDFKNGTLILEKGKTLLDYINEYSKRAKDEDIHRFAIAIGVDEDKLRELYLLASSGENINDFGRLDKLEETLKIDDAQKFIELIEHKKVSRRVVRRESDIIIRKFITDGGFDVSTMLDVWPKLKQVEEDHRVRDFIDMNLTSKDEITLEKLWTAVQHEFGVQYAGTTEREWYNMVRDYVKEKTHKTYLNNDDVVKFDMAAEP